MYITVVLAPTITQATDEYFGSKRKCMCIYCKSET